MHWDVVSGQLVEGEKVVCGVDYEEKADREAEIYKREGRTVVGVRYLETIEHDLSSDDPRYDPNQNVVGHRWCVIVED